MLELGWRAVDDIYNAVFKASVRESVKDVKDLPGFHQTQRPTDLCILKAKRTTDYTDFTDKAKVRKERSSCRPGYSSGAIIGHPNRRGYDSGN